MVTRASSAGPPVARGRQDTIAPPQIWSTTHGRFLVAFNLFFVLAFVVPAFTVRLEPPQSWTEFAAAMFAIVVSSARLSQLGIQGTPRILTFTFWLFIYVWLGLASLGQLMRHEFPAPGDYSTGRVLSVYLLIALGVVAYEVGLRLYPTFGDANTRFSRVRLAWSLRFSRIVLLGIVSFLVSLAVIIQLGGVSEVLASRTEVTAAVSNLAGGEGRARWLVVLRLMRLPPFVALYLLWWCWVYRRHDMHQYLKLLLLGLITLNGLMTLLVSNPVNSPRYWVGTILISLMFVTFRWRPLALPLWIIGCVLALVLVFPFADMFRRSTEFRLETLRAQSSILAGGDYDAFQQMLNAHAYVGDVGFTRGKQLVGTLLFWVPRSIWHSKPIPSGTLVAEKNEYRFTNVSMPMWGEFYLDGGFLAVAVGFWLYGVLTGYLERGFIHGSRETPGLTTILPPILAAYQLLLLRGALMSSFAYLVPILGLIGLAGVHGVTGFTRSRQEPTVARNPTGAAGRPMRRPARR